MRRILWIFVGLLATAAPALAQGTPAADQDDPPRWDANVSAALFQGRPEDRSRGYDDWYNQGRYAASIGRFWTTHFKTELEFATTGEGRRFSQEVVAVPGTVINYPIGVETYHQLKQTAARAVWQFNDNAWVHPYLNAGVMYEVEQTRKWSPEQYYYPGDPRSVPRVPISGEFDGQPRTEHRVGFTVGGGSKFYFAPSGYINTGIQITRAKPNTTVSLLAGIGIEF